MTKTFASFDTGPSGSQGPWILWAAQTRGFTLRSGSEKVPFDGFASGVVLDIHNMKTGWQRSEGIAGVPPEWKWNQSVSHFEERPGEDWKQGFHIPCATLDGQTAIWEQAGVSAWNGLVDLVPALRQQPADDLLPLVTLVGVREAKFAKGKAIIPVLKVARWVPRPAGLMDGMDLGGAPASPTQGGAAVGQSAADAAQARDAASDDGDFVPF